MKGIRKTSVANTFILDKKNNKQITINGKDIHEYFQNNQRYITKIVSPLNELDIGYSLRIKVTGGGINGQSESIRYSISRTLANDDLEFKQRLNKAGFLKCDTRQVERKKTGLRKARKARTFVRR
mgnify:CR=1 FL=1